MTKQEHTPTLRMEVDGTLIRISGESTGESCGYLSTDARALAVVRNAVNAHEELVAAITDALGMLTEQDGSPILPDASEAASIIDKLRTALAKAEGSQD